MDEWICSVVGVRWMLYTWWVLYRDLGRSDRFFLDWPIFSFIIGP